MTKYEVEEKTVEYLKTVFDPEIPVNVWDLGMIYKIDVHETELPVDNKTFDIDIDMTFTAPNCPAADFILVHNHPSGNMKPSRADDDLTAKVKGAAKAVNIRMLDHVIVSEDDYYSYAENGKM